MADGCFRKKGCLRGRGLDGHHFIHGNQWEGRMFFTSAFSELLACNNTSCSYISGYDDNKINSVFLLNVLSSAVDFCRCHSQEVQQNSHHHFHDQHLVF